MDRATEKRRLSLRLKPLTACLAASLAIASIACVNASAVSQEQLDARQLASMPAHLRDMPGFTPWQRVTPVPSAMEVPRPFMRTPPTLPASTVPVTNCDDSGTGSLRDALQTVAVDGDTVDLTNLPCSVITLTTGSILFFQNNITLQGPSSGAEVYLSGGSGSSRVAPLLHDGTGTLTINNMTIEDGAKYFTSAQSGSANGGCIFSGGTVDLNDSEVKYCTVQNTGTSGALGGAIYAAGGVSLSDSRVIDSSVVSATADGNGGGIYSLGEVTLADSFVEGNTASGVGGGVFAKGGALVKYSQIAGNEANTIGGIYVYGNATMENSTVSSNTAGTAGGLWFDGKTNTLPVTLLSSTVSGNNATAADFGGAFIYGGNDYVRVANNTIAFNTTHYTGAAKYGAGLHILFSPVDIESNIIAGNTNDEGSGPLDDDFDGSQSVTVSGANNLIGVASISPPSDTISADPQLQPLAFNGGNTETHAIQITSPAINAGNDVSNVAFDQRGNGFPRVSGSQADIGAYEFDLDDVIFFDGFED